MAEPPPRTPLEVMANLRPDDIVPELVGSVYSIDRIRNVGIDQSKKLYKILLLIDTGAVVDCVAWNESAEMMENHDLKPGELVYVTLLQPKAITEKKFQRGDFAFQMVLTDGSSVEVFHPPEVPTNDMPNRRLWVSTEFTEIRNLPVFTKIKCRDAFIRVLPNRSNVGSLSTGVICGREGGQVTFTVSPGQLLSPDIRRMDPVEIAGTWNGQRIVVEYAADITKRPGIFPLDMFSLTPVKRIAPVDQQSSSHSEEQHSPISLTGSSTNPTLDKPTTSTATHSQAPILDDHHTPSKKSKPSKKS